MADKPVRADKAAAVAELAEQFRTSPATLLTEYRGLTVAQLTQLRRSLGERATYEVAKNTLAKRAAANAGIDGLDTLFTGPTALAFVSGDPVEAAKGLRDFAKAHPLLVIKGGSTTGWGSGGYTWTLPVAAAGEVEAPVGILHTYDTSANSTRMGAVNLHGSSTSIRGITFDNNPVTSAAPFTWASGDIITLAGTYEAAS